MNLFVPIFMMITFSSIHAQRLKKCGVGESCIPLNSCPVALKLLRNRRMDEVRSRICDVARDRNRPMVCCKVLDHLRTRMLPTSCGQVSIGDRIIGGRKVQVGEYPWNVALGYTERGGSGLRYDCGGTIISDRYVLTAAHCVHPEELGTRRLSKITLGATTLTSNKDCIKRGSSERCYQHITASPEEIVIHPQFKSVHQPLHDIALIRLNFTLDFKDRTHWIEPICLPPNSDYNLEHVPVGLRAVAAGWGLTANASSSPVMRSVAVPIVETDRCARIYTRFGINQLCVGSELGMDTCKGDSGGALVRATDSGPPYTQFAIVSYGRSPCGSNHPGVYTSVVDYMDWIENNIKP